jgi:hypothetical protein
MKILALLILITGTFLELFFGLSKGNSAAWWSILLLNAVLAATIYDSERIRLRNFRLAVVVCAISIFIAALLLSYSDLLNQKAMMIMGTFALLLFSGYYLAVRRTK